MRIFWQVASPRQSCTQFCATLGGCVDDNFDSQSLSSMADVAAFIGLSPTTIGCGNSLLTDSDVCTDEGSNKD
jgi:hypothetical protein